MQVNENLQPIVKLTEKNGGSAREPPHKNQYVYRFNAATPVIASQRRSVGVAIRPPEALPITEMLVVRRKNGLPHQ